MRARERISSKYAETVLVVPSRQLTVNLNSNRNRVFYFQLTTVRKVREPAPIDCGTWKLLSTNTEWNCVTSSQRQLLERC